ncbi:unnamed protein product [Ilex paraguariensis]|uniref:Uncharacterized protein n=1 Tax=Ilex paraguariensis TaxID=185542 RepID=A0ABC8SBF0_9AQUA
MKESRQMAWMEEEGRRHSISNASTRSNKGQLFGVGSSQPSSSGIKRRPPRNYSVKKGASVLVSGIDLYMFSSKQKSVKGIFSGENLKKVKKAISKFFLFNAIPFNVTDSGPYYQSMIDTIADAGPRIKDPQDIKLVVLIWTRRFKRLACIYPR